jgi:hypothetical protein
VSVVLTILLTHAYIYIHILLYEPLRSPDSLHEKIFFLMP